ncbi:MAG: dihydroorotate dehydrogenase [Erysipelotrichaceae bacterium]
MKTLEIQLGNHRIKNPILGASGCFGFGKEFDELYGLETIGGLSLKSATLEPRVGNAMPRLAEVDGGMLNAIGLQNPGVDHILNHELDHLEGKDTFVLANIAGSTLEEYVAVSKRMDVDDRIHALELNISCPNVKHGGIQFGSDPATAAAVVTAIKNETKKPLYVKLSPNVTDIVSMATAVEVAGADGLVMINTLVGMRIDLKSRKPILANKIGGMSGNAIKPVAIRMIYQVFPHVNIPIIGVGGVSTAEDVIEFLLAGASCVQVGSANFVNPFICKELVSDLQDYCKREKINNLSELIGLAHKENVNL